MIPSLVEILETAREAADAAAAVHREHADSANIADATEKGRAGYVSTTDLAAQEACLAVIQRQHPDHEILAEEGHVGDSGIVPSKGLTWIVDPLDGTTNFLHGHPMHASSVAFAIDGTPAVGAISCAPTGERWWAARGLGAWKNRRSIQTSSIASTERALIGTGFPFKKEALLREHARQLVRVLEATGGTRRGGSAALDLCYLAEGRFEAFWELFLNPWDFAAGWVIVEESGGVIGRVEGGPLTLEPGTVIGANAPAMRDALLGLIQEPGLDNKAGPDRSEPA